jgi:hypothetical protein
MKDTVQAGWMDGWIKKGKTTGGATLDHIPRACKALAGYSVRFRQLLAVSSLFP